MAAKTANVLARAEPDVKAQAEAGQGLPLEETISDCEKILHSV